MRAERKGPLLPPQHISHAGREPRTLTPKPRLDTHASHPDSRPLQCHRGMVGGEKMLPAMVEECAIADCDSAPKQHCEARTGKSVTFLQAVRTAWRLG